MHVRPIREVRAWGDEEHPPSRAFLRLTGRSSGAFPGRPDRLGKPGLNGKSATWDATLDDLPGRIAACTLCV